MFVVYFSRVYYITHSLYFSHLFANGHCDIPLQEKNIGRKNFEHVKITRTYQNISVQSLKMTVKIKLHNQIFFANCCDNFQRLTSKQTTRQSSQPYKEHENVIPHSRERGVRSTAAPILPGEYFRSGAALAGRAKRPDRYKIGNQSRHYSTISLLIIILSRNGHRICRPRAICALCTLVYPLR